MTGIPPLHTAYRNLLSKGRLTTDPSQAALVDRLFKLQQRLTTESSEHRYSHDHGIYVYGGVGTGKSRIVDLFAATLPSTISKRRVHFHEFMMDIHMRLHRARQKASYRGDPLVEVGQEICRETRVLCFDEFQVHDIADAMILKRLFGSFWNGGGVMVSTSNRHPSELYKNGLNRSLFLPFIDDLQRRCEVWKMEAQQDYRMSTTQHSDQENICFFEDKDAFLASLMKSTDGQALGLVVVTTVTNRKFNVQAATVRQDPKTRIEGKSRSVVQTTFPFLCEGSMSSVDYHALCRFATTIYISDVRQFAADELDFLRRFITLIDIAYEYKTRIVIHSQVPLLKVFKKVLIQSGPTNEIGPPILEAQGELRKVVEDKNLSVRREGGSSSSMMSTFVGEVEWSATGLQKASLATGGAGETDVRFAVGRALSRLYEMNSTTYGQKDD